MRYDVLLTDLDANLARAREAHRLAWANVDAATVKLLDILSKNETSSKVESGRPTRPDKMARELFSCWYE